MNFIVKNTLTNSAKKISCDRAELLLRIESIFHVQREQYILQEKDEETSEYIDGDMIPLY